MIAGIERRQRWAAFSVRAHRDIGSLAADILLYDRIILPVPEDDPERDRWIRREWNPDDIAKRIVQSAGHIIPVPWTAQLRTEWKNRWEELRNLGKEVAYGLTGVIYASYPPAWTVIAAGLQPDELPERKPFILAGYQSPEEAKAELGWQPLEDRKDVKSEAIPGGRPVDHVVALHIRRMVHEPNIPNPEESFLAAVQLAENERFLHARRKLFDWEDDLFVDGWDPQEAEKKLSGLEEEYRDAVKAEVAHMCLRGVATLLPKAGGWGVTALGHPELKEPTSKTLEFVTGKFVDMAKPQDSDALPGAVLHMIRAAYRSQHATPVESDTR